MANGSRRVHLELKSRSELAHSVPSASPGDEAAEEARPRAANQNGLPTVGTPEFDERCQRAMEAVCQKYAYTAQQGGIVLRRNPLKLAPLTDYVFSGHFRRELGVEFSFDALQRQLAKEGY